RCRVIRRNCSARRVRATGRSPRRAQGCGRGRRRHDPRSGRSRPDTRAGAPGVGGLRGLSHDHFRTGPRLGRRAAMTDTSPLPDELLTSYVPPPTGEEQLRKAFHTVTKTPGRAALMTIGVGALVLLLVSLIPVTI